MKLLSVETSSTQGSLCLSELSGSTLKFHHELIWSKQSSHSEEISNVLLQALKDIGWKIDDLTHIAVGIGPGSFTGIRVGLNFCKALAYGKALPILGLNSLEVLAESSRFESLPTACLVNAYRNQIYAAVYHQDRELISPRLLDLDALDSELQDTYLCRGDALEVYASDISSGLRDRMKTDSRYSNWPSALNIAKLLSRDPRPSRFSDWKSVNPLYIRVSSAEEKLMGGALKPPQVF